MNLKDEYNKDFVKSLSINIAKEYNPFNDKLFFKQIINKNWESKELKERIRYISKKINEHLNIPYPEQLEVLKCIAQNYKGLQGMLFPDFVQVYGQDDFKNSINALKLFTQYSTAEFAIRPFIEKYPKKTLNILIKWSNNKNKHLRRLASEGTRPKLPWASPLRGFIKDPSPCIPILENLKADESLYVKKSVANHLNDISKNHPDLVLEICKKWHGKNIHTNWIVKHALRTLLKQGNKKALTIFGLDNANEIEIQNLTLSSSKIKIGDFIHFEFDVINNSKVKRDLRLEYKINFVKSNGSTSGKVFQISEFSLKENSIKSFKRKQWFKELTTRKHYPGTHKITLIVNGEEKKSIDLKLIKH